MSAETPAAATSVPGEQAMPIPPSPDKATPEGAHRRPGKARRSRTPPEQRTVEVLDGVKVIKLHALSGLGQAAEQASVRRIGHGRLLLAAETAEQAILQLGATVQRLLAQDPPCEPKQLTQIMQLQRDFNQALIDIGVAQIRADSEPSSETTGTTGADSRMPLPAGASIPPPPRREP